LTADDGDFSEPRGVLEPDWWKGYWSDEIVEQDSLFEPSRTGLRFFSTNPTPGISSPSGDAQARNMKMTRQKRLILQKRTILMEIIILVPDRMNFHDSRG
jgi:hypothetical protein